MKGDEPSLATDATVFDVLTSLSNPAEWFRAVLRNVNRAASIDPDATVRIGVTGGGKSPYHLITYRDEADQTVHPSFYGAKEDTSAQTHPNSPAWSTKPSALAEVKVAFNQLPLKVFKKGR